MQPLLSSAQDWRHPFWLALLIASSFIFTLAFACAVPFAAFAAATALTLSKRDAFILIIGIWLANQLTGFFFMNYPWDVNTFAWGIALGITAIISCAVARVTAMRLSNFNPLLCRTLAFFAAFMAYEASCYASAFMLGGVDDFTLAIQTRIFALNACALVGLFVVNYVGASLRLTPTLVYHHG
jgi:hypothetical protein